MGLRIAAEGAVRESIFDNEEPGRGAGRLAGRGAAAGGTARSRLLRFWTPLLFESLISFFLKL